jgi:Holliday junction DNA helicase RuvA
MIGKLIGKIDSIYDDKLILNVNGVGYNVFTSSKTLNSLSRDQEISLIIETIVREDHIHLFGFRNEIERGWFNELGKVKGVGNKVGLKILSVLDINDIILAISAEDKAHFSSVPGIGPKLAQRIVTELKDSVPKVTDNLISGSTNLSGNSQEQEGNIEVGNTKLLTDAVSALENLGYKRMDVYKIVSQNINENPETTLETLITNSLRKISK